MRSAKTDNSENIQDDVLLDESENKETAPTENQPETRAKKPRKARRFGVFLLACLAIIISILWVQRYAIIENYAQDKLAEQGITSELSLTYLSKNRAVIEDIHLESEGERFFSAKTLNIDYHWRDALKAKFDRIIVIKPDLNIALNAKGEVTSKWLPETGSGNDNPPPFPTSGIDIRDGTLALQTPFGLYRAAINATTKSPTDITATLQADPQTLAFNNLNTDIGGQIDIRLDGQTINYTAKIDAPRLGYDGYNVSSLSAEWTANTDRETILKNLNSEIMVTFESVTSQEVMAKDGKIVWNGLISAPQTTSDLPVVNGRWKASIKEAGVVNKARRQRLAKSVTLNETLMNISASAPFAPGLTATIDTLMATHQLDAEGTLFLTENGAKLDLTSPTQVIGQTNALTLRSTADHPFFIYDRAAETLTVAFNGNMSGPYATAIRDGQLIAKIEDGRHFSNVISFAAAFETMRTWRAQTPDKRPARLSPMKANITYDASEPTRRVRIVGGVDYDGDVPGGHATGLKARGVLNLNLRENSLSAMFTPARNQPIKIAQLDTPTDWVIHDAIFDLSSAGPQYRRAGNSTVKARIMNAQGRLAHRLDARDLNIKLAAAEVDGTLTLSEQNWDVLAEGAHVTSDTFPSEGTDIKAPKATLTARLTSTDPVYFTMKSPSADIKTPLVQATNMSVVAMGAPEDFSVRYGETFEKNPGLVKFSAGQLPVLPLRGDAIFKNAAWTGTAQTSLPRANDTPINIVYRFENGVGTANVDIVDLPFAPSKLQPQQLVSALSGKISRVEGLVSTNIDLSFGLNQPLRSSGTAVIKNLGAATLPGPFTGLNGELTFSSFFPLQTDGVQSMTLERFDPGFPLEAGKLNFEIIPDGVKIRSAVWPLGTGTISLAPTSWLYSAAQNRVSLQIDNVSLGEFLKNVGGGKLRATGDVSGVLPILIEGVKVHVEEGRLSVEDGGLIEYNSPQTEVAAERNEYAAYAFDALKHFKYDQLEALLNGPLDGPMRLRMKFGGANPDVLSGTEFKFNVGVEGELLNIMRSFQMGDAIGAQIIQDIQTRQTTPPQTPQVQE